MAPKPWVLWRRIQLVESHARENEALQHFGPWRVPPPARYLKRPKTTSADTSKIPRDGLTAPTISIDIDKIKSAILTSPS